MLTSSKGEVLPGISSYLDNSAYSMIVAMCVSVCVSNDGRECTQRGKEKDEELLEVRKTLHFAVTFERFYTSAESRVLPASDIRDVVRRDWIHGAERTNEHQQTAAGTHSEPLV